MDRLERDRLEERRRLGQLLAAHVRRHAADDLEQAGGAGVDHPGLLEDVELLRRPCEGDLAGGEQVRSASSTGRSSAASSSARSASARATVRIVPSCGFRTAA